jgi:phosphonate metabolism protein PhnN/1,5-bisphosphokinase (PRPP-forming)
MLVLVVGPSGAGKDTLIDAARVRLGADPRFRWVRRVVTRPAEAGGEDHEPADPETFTARRDAGGFALWWEAHGVAYGIPADIATDLAAGRVVIGNASRTVIADTAARFPVTVIEVTAPAEVLAARLNGRGREDAADIAGRLARTVNMPDGVAVERIDNGGTLADGVAAMVAALTRVASAARR